MPHADPCGAEQTLHFQDFREAVFLTLRPLRGSIDAGAELDSTPAGPVLSQGFPQRLSRPR